MIWFLVSLLTTIGYLVLVLAIFGRIKLKGKGFDVVFSLRWCIFAMGIASFIITIWDGYLVF